MSKKVIALTIILALSFLVPSTLGHTQPSSGDGTVTPVATAYCNGIAGCAPTEQPKSPLATPVPTKRTSRISDWGLPVIKCSGDVCFSLVHKQ